MFRSDFRVVRTLYYTNVLATVAYLIAAGPSVAGVLLTAFVFFLMNPVGIAITYHRYWSHRSFQFRHPALRWFCTFWAMASGVGSIIGWVGVHRDHHRHSDEEGDPHLAARGYLSMLLMRSYEYEPSPRKVIDLLRDPLLVKLHQHYFLVPLVYAAMCFAIGGIDLLVAAFCAPAAISLIVQNTTNYWNHRGSDGYRPANVGWINFLNFGDGWHRNHHDDPTSYTTSRGRHQVDPAGWVIRKVLTNG